MSRCLFSHKKCPYKERALFVNNVSRIQYIKLVQYVLCQFNGEFRGGITPTTNHQYIYDYAKGFCCGTSENCEQFVNRCIYEIYGYKIPNLLDGNFGSNDRVMMKVINSEADLNQLLPGSTLFTISLSNKLAELISCPEVSISFLRSIKPTGAIFSHVFFYLGKLKPSQDIYIGGLNHASLYLPCGVAKFNTMFKFEKGILSYIAPQNANQYKLLATIFV